MTSSCTRTWVDMDFSLVVLREQHVAYSKYSANVLVVRACVRASVRASVCPLCLTYARIFVFSWRLQNKSQAGPDVLLQITDRQGPDTGTWSMHTVGWLELGDEQRARENFRMMFRNINPPFKACPLYNFCLRVFCNDMSCFTQPFWE